MHAFSFALLFCLPLLAQQAPLPGLPPREAVLEEVAVRYDVAKWPRGQRRAGLALGAVALKGFVGGPVEQDGELPPQRAFSDEREQRVLLVQAYVGEQTDDAQKRALGWLANVSKPGTVPTAAAAGIPVGDIGFVGWSKPAERRIAWIVFVRDNLAVRVSCMDPSENPHPDLAAVAQTIDAAIAQEPLVAAGPLPRPKLPRCVADRTHVRAGENVVLSIEATDPAGSPTLQFEVQGPGQGYVTADAGRWLLRTTGPGRLVVQVKARGVRGLATTQSVIIDVAPRDD